MKQKIRITLMMVMVCSLIIGTMGAANMLYAQNEEEKAVNVRSRDSRTNEFQVSFEPLKPVYNVGERIQFKVKGNKTFYLYLFSIDEARNRGQMLIPNVLQQYSKYTANKEFLVPEKNVEIYSDQPGTEKIVMVASIKKLDVKIERYSKSGNFFASSSDIVKEDVKALHIGSREKDEERLVQEVSLVIVGQGRQPADDRRSGDRRSDDRRSDDRRSDSYPPPVDDAVSGDENVSTFISADRTEYRVGESIKITFGADQKGYVHLFSIEPDGRRAFLKKQAVSGREYYQVRAKASHPSGRHTLAAIYSKGENLDKNISGIMGSGAKKRIDLIDDGPESYAVYPIDVRP